MCAIAGFIGEGDDATLQKMIACLKHRGPDDTGVWREGSVGLAHARLAVIDLSEAGHQPMQDASGRFTIVFNGEIYNYKTLRAELALQYTFKTESDTEVILAAYSVWGKKCFARLDGMFALALYDAQHHTLVLARDPLGKKPLYWTYQKGSLVFGSELKALLCHGAVSRDINRRALTQYLAHEYVPTPHTIFDSTYKLMPGSILSFTSGEITQETFWNPCAATTKQPVSEAEALQQFEELLDEAVAKRLVADVPLGIFLSGGLDSSSVAYVASKLAQGRVKTFSVGFEDVQFDESAQARQVAAHLGTEHHEAIFSAHDALSMVRDISSVCDEPVADASILPTLLLSRFTRKSVTVALGGDGADELLLGYPTFKAEQFARYYARVPKVIKTILKRAASVLPASGGYLGLDFKVKKFLNDFDDDPAVRHLQWLGAFREDELALLLTPQYNMFAHGITKELAQQWTSESAPSDTLNNLSHLYLRTYCMDQVLVKVDRASMHYALEVRTPFLDKSLTSFLLALPSNFKYRNGTGKYLLRTLMRWKLPDAILDRPKQGFAPPIGAWLRGPLKETMLKMLSEERLKRQGIFEAMPISLLIEEHLSCVHDHRKKLWTLLVFQLWYDAWIV